MAEEAAEEAARVALRAGGRALELGEALRAALAGGRLEIARARYALGAGRVGAFAAPRDRLRARLRVARAGTGDSGVGVDPWDLRALAAALPRGAEGGGARGSRPQPGGDSWRLEEATGEGGEGGEDPLVWFGAGACGGGSPHLARAQAHFREAAKVAVELAGLRSGLQRLPPGASARQARGMGGPDCVGGYADAGGGADADAGAGEGAEAGANGERR